MYGLIAGQRHMMPGRTSSYVSETQPGQVKSSQDSQDLTTLDF